MVVGPPNKGIFEGYKTKTGSSGEKGSGSSIGRMGRIVRDILIGFLSLGVIGLGFYEYYLSEKIDALNKANNNAKIVREVGKLRKDVGSINGTVVKYGKQIVSLYAISKSQGERIDTLNGTVVKYGGKIKDLARGYGVMKKDINALHSLFKENEKDIAKNRITLESLLGDSGNQNRGLSKALKPGKKSQRGNHRHLYSTVSGSSFPCVEGGGE